MDHGVMDFLTLASKMGENSRKDEQQRQQHHQQYSRR
jgi:hypothetical protein